MKSNNDCEETFIFDIVHKLLENAPRYFEDAATAGRARIPNLRCVVLLKIDNPSESQLKTLQTLREFFAWSLEDISSAVKQGEIRLRPQMEKQAIKERTGSRTGSDGCLVAAGDEGQDLHDLAALGGRSHGGYRDQKENSQQCLTSDFRPHTGYGVRNA